MYFTLLTVHPNPKSLSHQFSDIVFKSLQLNHQVELIHLYQDEKGNFEALNFWEEKAYINNLELRKWRETQVQKTDKFIVFFPIR